LFNESILTRRLQHSTIWRFEDLNFYSSFQSFTFSPFQHVSR
jgi:hypothetical protein